MKRQTRIQDPRAVNPEAVRAQLGSGLEVIIQFSGPGYGPQVLQVIDDLCRTSGPDLCLRFYDHWRAGFDCGVLRHVPHVKSLYLDCLHAASNFDALKNLRHLEKLNVGIHELDEPDFLSWENLHALTYLCLVETRKRNFDLRHLAGYRNLETLFLNGHTKNIDALGQLPMLSALSLSIPSKAPIAFVNQLGRLSKLTLILGGRPNLDEVHNHAIEELEIIRVRGFGSFGNLGGFGNLKTLVIEDQIQLEELVFSQAIPGLRDVRLYNCKSLRRVEGIHRLTGLHQLRIYQTAIEFPEFIKQPFPESLKILAFYTAREKADKKIQEELGKMGYTDGLS